MRKFIVMPDSFKGTMTSIEACDIIEKAINDVFPDSLVQKIPIADGGEGSVDCFLHAMGGKMHYQQVKDANFQEISAAYGIFGKTAIIEMASCVGLAITEPKNPEKTTTFGVGEQILAAIDKGVDKIILALGGSSTNDCGAGMAAALGAKFFDDNNNEFVPTGGTLGKISRFDWGDLPANIKNIEFVAMCDVDNPLYGENGATMVYSKQKGADTAMQANLEQNVKAFADFCIKNGICEQPNFSGAGAAGGMGFATKCFLHASIEMGIDVVLDIVGFENLLKDTFMVISGEGRLDAQSLSGKVVMGIASRTKKHNVPLVALVGDIGSNIQRAYDHGLSAVFSINRVALPYEKIKLRAKDDLYLTSCDVFRLLSIKQ